MLRDAYEHVFEESIHLATVHAKYGSNHLEAALANSVSDNASSKNHKSSQVEQPFSIHLNANQLSYIFCLPGTHTGHALFILTKPPAIFTSITSPPPKAELSI